MIYCREKKIKLQKNMDGKLFNYNMILFVNVIKIWKDIQQTEKSAYLGGSYKGRRGVSCFLLYFLLFDFFSLQL